MTERTPPLEELQGSIATFVDQTERHVLILTTHDVELPIVLRVLDGLDGESPNDVYFVYAGRVNGAASYVDGLIAAVDEQLAEANAERAAIDAPPLQPVPEACRSAISDPCERLRAVLRHMVTWLPAGGEHRLVVALLPERIVDRETHARFVGALAPLRATLHDPWAKDVRLVLRDDRGAPYIVEALRRAQFRGPMLYTTRVTVGEIADALAEDAADPSLPTPRRIHALLQCAATDVALGRFERAIEHYGTLFAYYDTYGATVMKAVVLNGLGDILARMKRWPAARDSYLQALDLAADAESLTLILQSASAIGDVDMQAGSFAEASKSYALGASAAAKLGNVHVQADLLEKDGVARASASDLRGAANAWSEAAVVAREAGHEHRLASVVTRLRDISSAAGHRDLAARYDAELRDVRAALIAQRSEAS
jgi:tetratricopeptide (TPR) repeat protein